MVFGLALLLNLACEDGHSASEIAETTGLPYDLSVLLVKGSDREIAAYFDRLNGEAAHTSAQRARKACRRLVLEHDPERRKRAFEASMFAWGRMAGLLASFYNSTSHLQQFRAMEKLPLSMQETILSYEVEGEAIVDCDTLSLAEQNTLVHEWLLRRPHQCADVSRPLQKMGVLSFESLPDSSAAWYERSYPADLEQGDLRCAIWALTDLGMIRAMTNHDLPLGVSYLAEARKLGLRYGAGERTARAIAFEGSMRRDSGQWFESWLLKRHARRVALEANLGSGALRYQLRGMRNDAMFRCWQWVAKEYDAFQEVWNFYAMQDDPETITWGHKNGLLRAEILFGLGRSAEANEIMNEIADDLDLSTANSQDAYRDQHALWSQALNDEGNYQQAEVTALRGIERTRNLVGTNHLVKLWGEIGFARLHQSDLSGAREALAMMKTYGLSNTRLRQVSLYGCIGIELARAEGDKFVIEAQVEQALEGLTEHLARDTPSAAPYITIYEARVLLDLLHDMLSDAPMKGYRLQVLWNEVYRMIGGAQPAEPWIQRIMEVIRGGPMEQSLQLAEWLQSRGATHLVYYVGKSRVVRFEYQGGQVVRDSLSMSAPELFELQDRVMEQLATPPDSSSPWTGLRRDLVTLGRALLPDMSCHLEHVPAALAITPDAFLSALPFSALYMDDDPTSALGIRFDLFELRGAGRWRRATNRGPSVFLIDPRTPVEVDRRYGVQRSLPAGRIETSMAHELWPDAHIWTRADATKEALLSSWEQAPLIYIAAHTVSEPDAPYYRFIPLASDAPHDEDPIRFVNGALLVQDIRKADLSGCELVILSSCGSGAPYVELEMTAPSIGDAFLDSGVHAVVQTLWNVDDEEAARTTSSMARYYASGYETWQAVSEVRRDMAIRSGSVRHPYYWAVYKIALNPLPATVEHALK